MIRWTALAAFAVALTGAALVAGSNREDAPKPEKAAKAASTTGFFNMAKVMRESKRARAERKRLNAIHNRATNNIYLLRDRYLALQGKVWVLKDPDGPLNEMLKIARQVEDIDTAAQKAVDEGMSALRTKLHNETRDVVAGIAKENGLLAVLAYPDAATAEERNDPAFKELKLKSPAVQPFYLDPSVDFTDEIVKRLDAKFTAEADDR